MQLKSYTQIEMPEEDQFQRSLLSELSYRQRFRRLRMKNGCLSREQAGISCRFEMGNSEDEGPLGLQKVSVSRISKKPWFRETKPSHPGLRISQLGC